MGPRTTPLPRRYRRRLRSHDPPPPHRTSTMSTDTTGAAARPGAIARFRSRQSGHPTGLVGRIFGRSDGERHRRRQRPRARMLDRTHPAPCSRSASAKGAPPPCCSTPVTASSAFDPSATMVKQATARNRSACRDGRARPPPQRRHHDPVRRQHGRRRVQRPHRLLHARPDQNVHRGRPSSAPRRHPRHRLPHRRHPGPGMDGTATSTASPPLPRSPRCSPQPDSTASTTTPSMRPATSSTCSQPTSPTRRPWREHHQSEHARPAQERVAADYRHRRPRLGDTTDRTPRRVLGRDVHRRTRRPTHGSCWTTRRPDHARPRHRSVRDRRPTTRPPLRAPRPGHPRRPTSRPASSTERGC